MPRKIYPTITFDDAEDEVLFTTAALKADPDAKDLVSETATWLGLIDAARAKDRGARQAEAECDAARVVANGRLDKECTDFGDDLLRAVDKDTKSARWGQFFTVAVSRFVKQALGRQVERVRGWLASSKDPVLEAHRGALETWSGAAADALVATRAAAVVRGESRAVREQLAEDLTRERDGLHDALSARVRERKLPRDWPDVFFRVERRNRGGQDGADAAGQDPAPAPPV